MEAKRLILDPIKESDKEENPMNRNDDTIRKEEENDYIGIAANSRPES